ncbi:quinol:cytochrome C oxidoreductase [Pontibacter sp. G13]|uniref:quinol:cytochrome C oxidoreductase n=1 Tax=Pontibacter sp. G13 TaxID=3074898 RepID=UPI00288AD2C0|nr:quinol:cytochrome C oxidoreductase [Pontibacter sp. G13]WNJ16603.1 quinol:cytochrome C oxidoreductase [Pontibacter sp. G13]
MATTHYTTEQLTERFEFAGKFKTFIYGMIGVGIVLLLAGFFMDHTGEGHHDDHATTEHVEATHSDAGHGADSHGDEAHHEAGAHDEGHGGHHKQPTTLTRLLANVLTSALYFMTLTMGATFFLFVHRVANAGWQTAIRRIPEAIMQWIPVGVVIMILLFFAMPELYEWVWMPEGEDEIIDSKRGYLNMTLFIIRNLLFFAFWIWAAFKYRSMSYSMDGTDKAGAITIFNKTLNLSAAFVVVFALSICLFAFDWIMSLEPHWFSTIFGIYVFAGSMVSGITFMYAMVIFLQKQGYLKWVNDAHKHDLGKFVFGFSIFWGYIWVAQYLLIWYSNIPEEGIYYVKRYRTGDHAYLGYSTMFYFNILINFVTPFLMLMTRNAKRISGFFLVVCCIIFYGHFHDLFLMVMPGAMGHNPGIGFMEIGTWLVFAGAFLFVVLTQLTKANLASVNHPYMEESLAHSTGEV